jgi:hypothetical protein
MHSLRSLQAARSQSVSVGLACILERRNVRARIPHIESGERLDDDVALMEVRLEGSRRCWLQMSEHHGGAMLHTLGTSDDLLHVTSIMQLEALLRGQQLINSWLMSDVMRKERESHRERP